MDLLLIEDSEADSILLQRLLNKSLGATIHHVESVASAESALVRNFDAIVTDLHLPDGQGVDVVNRLRAFRPAIPLIVLTGGADEATAFACLRSGAQDYLSKNGLSTVAAAKAVLFAIHRKQFESQLERDLFEIISAQEEAAGLQGNYDQLLTSVCERTQRVVPATGAVVEFPDGDEMVYRACSGTAAAHVGMRLKQSTSLSGLAFTTGEILRSDDTETDPRVDRAGCRKIHIRSMIVVPLKNVAGTIGVLKAVSTQPYSFSSLDVGKLRVLSNVLSKLITQASTFAEKQKLVAELQDALNNVKTLSGLLPICSRCKKIRDDKGYWTQVEQYIGDHSAAHFTHSVCPQCAQLLYGEFLRQPPV